MRAPSKDNGDDRSSYKLLTLSERKEIDNFLRDLEAFTGPIFETSQMSNFVTAARNHLAELFINDRNQGSSNIFVKNCYPEKLMCDVLITSGITDLRPKEGVVFCSCVTGAYLMGMSQSFYAGKKRPSYKKVHLDTFVEPFQRRLFEGNADITTVVVPLNFDNKHWGMIFAHRFPNSLQRVESRVVRFGDSIGWKCPGYVLEFFKAAFDYAFPRKRVQWTASKKNYLLDDLKFEKQPDSYSCGAYVLAACSTFASDTGYLPQETFASGYDSALTDKYKWASARCRLMNIIYAYEEKGDVGVTEAEVSVFQHKQRKQWLRRRDEAMENVSRSAAKYVSDGNVSGEKKDDNFEEQGEVLSTRELVMDEFKATEMGTEEMGDGEKRKKATRAEDRWQRIEAIRNAEKTWYSNGSNDSPFVHHRPRKIRFKDSSLSVAELINGLLQAVVANHEKMVTTAAGASRGEGNGCRVTPWGTKSRSQVNVSNVDDKDHGIQTSTGVTDPKETQDLPYFVYELSKAGELFGVHRFRPICRKHVQRSTLISARLRCIRYKPPHSCRTVISANLRRSSMMWQVSRNSPHTHELNPVQNDVCLARYQSAITSMQGRLKEWTARKVFQDTTIPWDVFEATLVPFYKRPAPCVGVMSANVSNGVEDVGCTTAQSGKGCTNAMSTSKYAEDVGVRIIAPKILAEERTTSEVGEVVTDTCPIPIKKVGSVHNTILESGRTGLGTVDSSDACSDQREVELSLPFVLDEKTEQHSGLRKQGEPSADSDSSDEGGVEDASLLIDTFLEDEQPPPYKLFHGVESCDSQREFLDQMTTAESTGEKKCETESSDNSSIEIRRMEEGEALFKRALSSFVSGLEENASGNTALKEIQFIGNCFGYQFRIRDSSYHKHIPAATASADNTDGDWVLKSAFVECKMRGCAFSFILKTVNTLSGMEDGDSTLKGYRCRMRNWSHNHEPNPELTMDRLQPKLQKEALEMKNELYIPFTHIIRLLEAKYKVSIDTKSLRNKISYAEGVNYPLQEECMRLCKELIAIRDEDSQNRVFLTVGEEGRMDSAAWTYREWMDDYARYGFVPGISIDCKAISNRFGLPLLTINGRANDGCVLTFFMAFISTETEESFVRILSQFRSVIQVSPAMIAMDQSTPCINATKKVFPTSYIALDEWHLNQNQLRNCGSWCSKIGRKGISEEMSRDLFIMRQTRTERKFISRRNDFERKYFYQFQQEPPQWFRFLYHRNAEMIVAYYRNRLVPFRFLFQGTGYTECSNSSYRRNILQRKVPLWKIPSEMLRLTKKSRNNRLASRTKVLKPQSLTNRKITTCQLPIPRAVLDKLITEYTAYSLHKFVDLSVNPSRNCVVLDATIEPMTGARWPDTRFDDDCVLGTVVVFSLKWLGTLQSGHDNLETIRAPAPIYEVFLTNFPKRTYNCDEVLVGACTCGQHAVAGFPCRHIVRCAVTYPELLYQKPQLHNVLGSRVHLETLFDSYWKQNDDETTKTHLSSIRRKIGREHAQSKQSDSRSEGATTEDEDMYWGNINSQIDEEVKTYLSWSDGRAMFDKMHRLATDLGPIALRSIKILLESSIQALAKGRAPIPPTNHVQVNSEFKKILSGQKEDNDGIFYTIQNPNMGLTRNEKRKRGCMEVVKRKRPRRSEQPHLRGSQISSQSNVSKEDHGASTVISRDDVNGAIDK